MTLREQILQELREEAAKADAKIKDYDDTIHAEMFARSTITGGPFSNAARSACETRAQQARNQKAAVERSISWIKEMLAKYN